MSANSSTRLAFPTTWMERQAILNQLKLEVSPSTAVSEEEATLQLRALRHWCEVELERPITLSEVAAVIRVPVASPAQEARDPWGLDELSPLTQLKATSVLGAIGALVLCVVDPLIGMGVLTWVGLRHVMLTPAAIAASDRASEVSSNE